jgi:hypothetical protein
VKGAKASGLFYRWLASPAATRRLNCSDFPRGTLSDFHITCQKVRPSRSHVASHVFDDHGNRIHLVIQHREKLFIRHLREGSLRETFVIAE